MLKNYLTIAIRNLLKHKVYSLVSILGLAVGISFFTLIFLLISHELSYDRFHQKSERTYRIIQFLERNGVGEKSASVPFPLGPTVEKYFDDYIEQAVRLFNFQVSSQEISTDLHEANEQRFYFADTSFFDLFDFELAQGHPDSVLLRPMSVVITQKMASKYFGKENPIGKKLLYENRLRFTVTGVLTETEQPSHLQFDFLASFSSLEIMMKYYYKTAKDNWVWNPCWTYVELKEGVRPEEFEEKLKLLVERIYPKPLNEIAQLFLQPLEEIHLYSKLDFEIGPNGDIRYVYIFSGIAFLMLIITTTNFTNLSTARSSVRAKEIGIRKAIGADKSELVEQFLVESIFISLLSIFFSLILVELLLPVISEIIGSKIDLTKADKTILLACIFVSTIFVGVIASLYPSYYLARFRPSAVLSGTLSMGVKSKRIRSSLIVLQLVITAFFLICTFVSLNQAFYLRNMDVGFASDDLLMVPLPDPALRPLFGELKEALEKDDHIVSVTGVDEPIGLNHQTHKYHYAKDSTYESMFFPAYLVQNDFLTTLDLELVAGRDFDEEQDDEKMAVIINEKMVAFMGWETPQKALGKRLFMSNMGQKVIGVVKDFNYESLHHNVEPLVIDLNSANEWETKYIVARAKKGEAFTALGCIKQIWAEIVPNRKLESFVLKSEMDNLYEEEIRLGKISFYFADVCILISILGLFGLSSFVVEQRKKEIAIRKALGVTDLQLMWFLSKEFFYLVGFSLLFSWSASYLILNLWLKEFPFSTELAIAPFLTSGLVIFGITFGTISYHIIRAGLKLPIRDLQGS